MAILKLDRAKLHHNYNFLKEKFEQKNVEWGVVTKLLCGTKLYLQELISMGVREMHDTRIANMKVIKSIDPTVQTVYIKPPARRSIPDLILYADVSFNTDYNTIKLLSQEAQKQKKLHKIIIMIEMGDLREGVMAEDIVSFYQKVFALPFIKIVGIGTNFNCLNGIMPNQEKLQELTDYKKLIEAKFDHHIPWVSGGTSVTFSLLLNGLTPPEVNHFRIGEVLFFANNLFTDKLFDGMTDGVLTLFAEIIELKEKPIVPDGEQRANVAGVIPEFNPDDVGRTSKRAIVDVGLLDVLPANLQPEDADLEIIESSSDMMVIDLGLNEKEYKMGDMVSFKLNYMAALGLLHSYYIEKIIV